MLPTLPAPMSVLQTEAMYLKGNKERALLSGALVAARIVRCILLKTPRDGTATPEANFWHGNLNLFMRETIKGPLEEGPLPWTDFTMMIYQFSNQSIWLDTKDLLGVDLVERKETYRHFKRGIEVWIDTLYADVKVEDFFSRLYPKDEVLPHWIEWVTNQGKELHELLVEQFPLVKVLLVDDESSIRQYIAELLEGLHLHLISFAHLRPAQQADLCDLYISDRNIHLRGDGEQWVRTLLSQGRLATLISADDPQALPNDIPTLSKRDLSKKIIPYIADQVYQHLESEKETV